MNKRHPTQGGCWFCETDDDGHWMFSTEFDTYLHMECLKKALKESTEESCDMEAEIMGRELLPN